MSELAVARIHASKSTGPCTENMEGVETVRAVVLPFFFGGRSPSLKNGSIPLRV